MGTLCLHDECNSKMFDHWRDAKMGIREFRIREFTGEGLGDCLLQDCTLSEAWALHEFGLESPTRMLSAWTVCTAAAAYQVAPPDAQG